VLQELRIAVRGLNNGQMRNESPEEGKAFSCTPKRAEEIRLLSCRQYPEVFLVALAFPIWSRCEPWG
jgi:hypothetical protein